MNKRITAFFSIVCFCFAASLYAGAAQSQSGLSLTCQTSKSSISPSAGFPIWLDVSLINKANVPFDGYCDAHPGNDISATTSRNDIVANTVQKGSFLNGICSAFTLQAGGTQHFHVLLNELLPVVHPGILSGHIIFPIDQMLNHAWLGTTLVAPFTIHIEPPLTQKQLQAASKRLVADLEGNDQDVRSDAEREVKVLPDASAVPILVQVTNDIPFAPWAIDGLGSRPRTVETANALLNLAQSANADTHSGAKSYLSRQ